MKKLSYKDVNIYIEKIAVLVEDFNCDNPGGRVKNEHIAGRRLLFNGVLEEYPDLTSGWDFWEWLEGDASREIKIEERGKPYFQDRSLPRFSISHSGEYVVCALSKHEVGCDIQIMEGKDSDRTLKIGKRFFSEREFLDMERAEDPQDYFYRIWTIKESYIKALGEGLSLPLDSFYVEISEGDSLGEKRESQIRITDNNSNKNNPDRESVRGINVAPRVFEFELPGYKGAVCVLSQIG